MKLNIAQYLFDDQLSNSHLMKRNSNNHDITSKSGVIHLVTYFQMEISIFLSLQVMYTSLPQWSSVATLLWIIVCSGPQSSEGIYTNTYTQTHIRKHRFTQYFAQSIALPTNRPHSVIYGNPFSVRPMHFKINLSSSIKWCPRCLISANFRQCSSDADCSRRGKCTSYGYEKYCDCEKIWGGDRCQQREYTFNSLHFASDPTDVESTDFENNVKNR